MPQFFLSGEGFRFQRFRHSPRHLPSLPPGLGPPPHTEAGGCGDWEGLAGFTRPPGAWVPGSGGDAVSGSRAAFKKLNTIFGNPPVGILPLHTRHNTHSPPLFHSSLPRFLLLPLLPPTFQPIILPPYKRKGSGRNDEVSVFVSQPLGSFWARNERPPSASQLSGKVLLVQMKMFGERERPPKWGSTGPPFRGNILLPWSATLSSPTCLLVKSQYSSLAQPKHSVSPSNRVCTPRRFKTWHCRIKA